MDVCRFQTEKLTGECAVLKRGKRFVYYLVKMQHWTTVLYRYVQIFKPSALQTINYACFTAISQITKKKATQKPTYDSLRRSLEDMKSHCIQNGVTRVSMPRYVSFILASFSNASPNPSQEGNIIVFIKTSAGNSMFSSLTHSIGCGLDRLQWDRVSAILEQVFSHANISITVYSLPERTETTVMKENTRR